MARITRFRLVAAIAVVLCLLVAPLVIFSGVSPVGTTLADYLGGRASSATCSGSLQAGTVIGMAATSDDDGYWVANNEGLVVACGDAQNFGSLTSIPNSPIVGIDATPNRGGYYLVASDGGVFTFGDAVFQGSTGALRLNKPVVGMAVDARSGGYWLVASDGGIFSFNAPFYGSTGSITLNKPIVGMAPDVGTGGYWLVASDGGIFSFNAPFYGSMGAVTLNKPIVGMAPDVATGGYWLVAADGGIFSFGAPFFGSTGAIVLSRPIYGMEANGNGTGYRFVASDGGIFDFGSSTFFGSAVAGVTTLPATAPTTTSTSTAPPTTPTTPTPTPTPTPTTTPTTAPPAVGTVSVSFVPSSALGCGQPATPGCLEYIAVNGSGWAPNRTYDLTIKGPNLNGITTGSTATTNSQGVISSASGDNGTACYVCITTTNASTSDPPTPGLYSITMDGVTGSLDYAPPKTITLWSIDYPVNPCNAGGVCDFPIQMIATGYPPDTRFPVSVTWNGTVINNEFLTTDDTGSVSLALVATTPASTGGTATVTFGGVSASETLGTVQTAPMRRAAGI